MRARHEGGPRSCRHCWEPVVRLQAEGGRQVSKWLHTPNRVPCIDPLTREPIGTDAAPRELVAAVSAAPSADNSWRSR